MTRERVDAHVIELDREPPRPELLSAAERARAASFRDPADARRYVAAHAALRRILARRCGTAPERLAIEADANGRPRLADAGGLSFSLSHAGGRALVAVCGDAPVGADIEPRRGLVDEDGVTGWLDRVGAPPSACAIDRWVRAEAVAKALGTGLPGLEAGALDRPHPYGVREVELGPDWAGAVAAPGRGWSVRLRFGAEDGA